MSIGRVIAQASTTHPRPQIIAPNPMVHFRLRWSAIAPENAEEIAADIMISIDESEKEKKKEKKGKSTYRCN